MDRVNREIRSNESSALAFLKARGPSAILAAAIMDFNILRMSNKDLNYYFENGIAYTEDHIPVRKLHLFFIPYQMKKSDLLDYFTENYGQIEHIEFKLTDEIIAELKRKEPERANGSSKYLKKSGYALFANVEDAAKVLCESVHAVKNHGFYVQARFSWLQPETNEVSYELQSQPADILKLTDGCLERVYAYLPLADQIHLARTCTRFRDIFKKISAILHNKIDFTKDLSLTLWDIRDFCRLSGSTVQHLKTSIGQRDSQSVKHFPNLKALDLEFMYNNPWLLRETFIGLNLLEELDISSSHEREPYGFLDNEPVWLSLEHLESLRKLKLYYCSLKGLRLPTSIQSLTIGNGCLHVGRFLPQMLKMQKQVKELYIDYDIDYPKNMIKEMVNWPSCATLEVLKVPLVINPDEYKLIPQLPNLKKLEIYGIQISSDIFTELAKFKSHQLEHLYVFDQKPLTTKVLWEISKLSALRTISLKNHTIKHNFALLAFCQLTKLESIDIKTENVSDDFVLKLLSDCTNLFDLNYSFHISESLVEKIVKQLRQEIDNGTSHRQLPMKLYMEKNTIYTTDFSRYLLSCKKIVKIIFIKENDDYSLGLY